MWAKTATPPVWSGWVSPTPPSNSWRPIQIPRNQIAGISRKKISPKKNAVSTRARGRRTKYAPRTPAIAPLAPMFGMLASRTVPNVRVTKVWSAVAATPAARYQSRNRTLPRASSMLFPKIQRNSMLPRMCTQLPCRNIEVNVPSHHDRCWVKTWLPTWMLSQGP
jgi:hypothetical protein